MNYIHEQANEHHAQIFMHQQSNSTIVCLRQFEPDQFSDFDCLMSVTRLDYPGEQWDEERQVIETPGTVVQVLFAAHLVIDSNWASEY